MSSNNSPTVAISSGFHSPFGVDTPVKIRSFENSIVGKYRLNDPTNSLSCINISLVNSVISDACVWSNLWASVKIRTVFHWIIYIHFLRNFSRNIRAWKTIHNHNIRFSNNNQKHHEKTFLSWCKRQRNKHLSASSISFIKNWKKWALQYS